MQQKIYISSSYIIKRQEKIGNIVFSVDYKGFLGSKYSKGSRQEIRRAVSSVGD
jgi:hypothetical protein